MGWIEVLARTYDNCLSEIGKINVRTKKYKGKEFSETIVLLPESHLTVNAFAEIRLRIDGEYITARKVDKNDQLTIVPVTEDSASRSSGITPMPLCAKLSYIAGDYDEYVQEEKNKRPCYEAYMKELHKWSDLPDTPKKIKAICSYLDKGCVMKDLTENGVYDGTDGFVRFIVTDNNGNDRENRIWLDAAIYDSFIRYYRTCMENNDVDYSTGKVCAVTQKLPAKLRNTGDKAKLISSNDSTNFTFKGRFRTAAEAAMIGYETSQKAHNALRWLIANQGYKNDSESIICWSPGNEPVPSPMESTDEYYEEDDDIIPDTEYAFVAKLNDAMNGYLHGFNGMDKNRVDRGDLKVVVMAVDTADGSNQGRLSITYYNEQHPVDFIRNIFQWHKDSSWIHYKKDSAGKNYYYGAPSPKEIILTAYGSEVSGGIDIGNKKMLKKNIDRLLPCIVQGRKIPKDIVHAVVINLGNPLRFSLYNRNRLLENACAVIRKYQIDYGKEVFGVSLNKESIDRDYLFGRLLAVAHNLEDYVNYKSNNTGRETNAMKYWSVYAQKPAKTYNLIRQRLQPYISKLTSGSRNYYLELAEGIFDQLSQTDSFNNEPLGENYLMGYYSQSAEFRKNRTKETTKEEN